MGDIVVVVAVVVRFGCWCNFDDSVGFFYLDVVVVSLAYPTSIYRSPRPQGGLRHALGCDSVARCVFSAIFNSSSVFLRGCFFLFFSSLGLFFFFFSRNPLEKSSEET